MSLEVVGTEGVGMGLTCTWIICQGLSQLLCLNTGQGEAEPAQENGTKMKEVPLGHCMRTGGEYEDLKLKNLKLRRDVDFLFPPRDPQIHRMC